MFNKKPSEACSKKIREEHQPNILVVYNMIDIFTFEKNMTSNRINDPKMFEHQLTYGDFLEGVSFVKWGEHGELFPLRTFRHNLAQRTIHRKKP